MADAEDLDLDDEPEANAEVLHGGPMDLAQIASTLHNLQQLVQTMLAAQAEPTGTTGPLPTGGNSEGTGLASRSAGRGQPEGTDGRRGPPTATLRVERNPREVRPPPGGTAGGRGGSEGRGLGPDLLHPSLGAHRGYQSGGLAGPSDGGRGSYGPALHAPERRAEGHPRGTGPLGRWHTTQPPTMHWETKVVPIQMPLAVAVVPEPKQLVKLPRFGATKTATLSDEGENWLGHLASAIIMNKWTFSQAYVWIKVALDFPAARWFLTREKHFQTHPDGPKASWHTFWTEFEIRSIVKDDFQLRTLFETKVQKQHETIYTYGDAMLHLS